VLIPYVGLTHDPLVSNIYGESLLERLNKVKT